MHSSDHHQSTYEMQHTVSTLSHKKIYSEILFRFFFHSNDTTHQAFCAEAMKRRYEALPSSIFSFIYKYLLPPPLRVVERELNNMRQGLYTQPNERQVSECARRKLMNNFIMYGCVCALTKNGIILEKKKSVLIAFDYWFKRQIGMFSFL